MKKIIYSLSALVIVVGVVAYGAVSFFNDTETSVDNTFTTGAIDLTVDSTAHYNGMVCTCRGPVAAIVTSDETPECTWQPENREATFSSDQYPVAGTECTGTWEATDLSTSQKFFDFSDLKPGDTGENTISLHLENNPAYVCATVDKVVDLEMVPMTEPEIEDGDNPASLEGELSQELNFMIWNDGIEGEDREGVGDNIHQDNEEILTQGLASAIGSGITWPLFDQDNGAMEPSQTQYLGVAWCYGEFDGGVCDGESVNNISQTDRLTADISFYVEQSRNNPNFSCPELKP